MFFLLAQMQQMIPLHKPIIVSQLKLDLGKYVESFDFVSIWGVDSTTS